MELGMFVRHASYAARGVALYSAGVMDKYDINCRKFNSYEMGNLAWATSLVLRWQAINGRSGRLFTALFLLATVIGIEILHHDLVLSRLFHRGQREFKMTQVMLIALDGISATLLCLFLFMKSPIIASAVNLMAFFILAVLLLAAEAHQLDIDVAQRAEQGRCPRSVIFLLQGLINELRRKLDRNGAYRALMQQVCQELSLTLSKIVYWLDFAWVFIASRCGRAKGLWPAVVDIGRLLGGTRGYSSRGC